ncbi:MAG TPA: PorV/PorQ family protein [bacterium]|nr:PorV/PorQ family protein [bacterium]
MKKIFISFLFVIFLEVSVFCAAGKNSFEFLQIGVGARAVALGGAYTAVSSDAFGMYWNCAGIADIAQHSEIAAQHNNWLEDIKYNFLGIANKINNDISLGAALYYLNSGNIQGRNISGGIEPDYKSENSALQIAIGLKTDKHSFFGFAVKYVKDKLQNTTADGVALDLGFKNTMNDVSVGLALSNFTLKKAKYNYDERKLPMILRTGIAYSLIENNFLISADIVKEEGESLYLASGIEYNVFKALALRIGYNGYSKDADKGIFCGAGLNFEVLNIDYAYIMSKELNDAHIINLKINF